MSRRNSRAPKIAANTPKAPRARRGRKPAALPAPQTAQDAPADSASLPPAETPAAQDAPKAASSATKPARRATNGARPETLAQVASIPASAVMLRLTSADLGLEVAQELPSLTVAQQLYCKLWKDADGAKIQGFPEGKVYSLQGIEIARISQNGRAWDMSGALIAEAPESLEGAPAVSVTIEAKYLHAVLAVAPKNDVRHYLNGVYIHQIGAELRMVATDGHRMLVLTMACDKVLPWGVKGVILPREEMGRIASFIGKPKAGEPLAFDVSFGVDHPFATIQESSGATFPVRPVDGTFPDYMTILGKSSDAFTAQREVAVVAAMNASYLKAAGAIAAQLESENVFPFFGGQEGEPTVFTFGGEPGALLFVMPIRDAGEALKPQTIKLIGAEGMKGTLAALKAHATRLTKAAAQTKDKAEKEKLLAKARGYTERMETIMASVAALPAPAAPSTTEAPQDGGESAEA
jgi:DNA polymerase-3 subunit beta